MKILTMLMATLSLITSVAAAEVIRVEGGGAATAGVFLPIQEAYQEASGNVVLITTTTPVKSLIALERGEVDLATAAARLTEMIEGAEKDGVVIDPATLRVSTIGKSDVLVYVNRANPVSTLSKQQLKGLFTGSVKNWREVGGKDVPVVVVWGKRTTSQNRVFIDEILDGEYVTPGAVQAVDYDDIRRKIIADPGAIGIDPDGFRMGAVRIVKTPKLTTDIIAVTKGAPSAKVQDLLNYISSIFALLSM